MSQDVNKLSAKTQAVGGIQFIPTGIRIMDGSVAPTDGTAGTGAGKAEPGSLYLRKDVATMYQNTGTKASPVWSSVAGSAATPTVTSINVGNGTAAAPSVRWPAGAVEATGFYRLSLGVLVFSLNGSPWIVWGGNGMVLSSSSGVFWGPTTNPTTHQTGNSTDTAVTRSGIGVVKITTGDTPGYGAIESLYDRFGANSPEGVVTAPIGAVYHRTNGGANTSLYVKESGAGNTGWVAK